MVRDRGSVIGQLDWLTIGLYLVLMICGWLSVCGAGFNFETESLLSFGTRTGKQLLWMVCGLGLGCFLLMFSQNFYRSYAWVFYVLMMLLLLVTIFIAKDTKGSRSWLELGPVKLQPAEFAKFATALALAKFVDEKGISPKNRIDLYKAMAIFLLPMCLIVAQKETGSALVYLAFFIVMYREGMNGILLFSGICAVIFFVLGIKFWETPFGNQPFTVGPFTVLLLVQIISAVLAWLLSRDRKLGIVTASIGVGSTLAGLFVSMLILPFKLPMLQIVSIAAIVGYMLYQALRNAIKECLVIVLFALGSTLFLYSCNYVLDHVLQDHQRTRINVVLGVEDDPTGAGYNVNQSKIAIGSGGLAGKGFLKGTQTKLKYVPEQDTDFIFCTIGEEQGFFGSTFVLLLYAAFLLRLLSLAERQSSVFGRIFGYSVVCILFFHLFINVGMVLGITPVIGIPLPFFSYGGSSLWGFTILLFVFLRIDSERTSRF